MPSGITNEHIVKQVEYHYNCSPVIELNVMTDTIFVKETNLASEAG